MDSRGPHRYRGLSEISSIQEGGASLHPLHLLRAAVAGGAKDKDKDKDEDELLVATKPPFSLISTENSGDTPA
jgi:hypothetical protein